jgi:oxygen-independent coproporphyrinogen-3 oxidase
MQSLLEKYNVPAPRYTSYPTVPFWQKTPPTEDSWKVNVKTRLDNDNEISLYLHLPFCESLCTYCGCNKRITKNHSVEEKYIDALLAEWKTYTDLSDRAIVIKELHFGGGTPTFFSPKNLTRLLSGIFKNAERPAEYAYSFESHPNNTTKEHLIALRNFGFNRISIGVQDFSPEIMHVINRRQKESDIRHLVKSARELGYESINFDLIFGLPFQTLANIKYNMERVAEFRPERIAFYSYAHVPWISPNQRAYSVKDLPVGQEKRNLYELGFEMLTKIGYAEIGLDHFSLPEDDLYKAQQNLTLHRNFMGYTPFQTDLLIGLGCSAISDSGNMYVQNEKKVENYQNSVLAFEIPIIRGHQLTRDEEIMRGHITKLMCLGETDWYDEEDRCEALYEALDRIDELEDDGLIISGPFKLTVTTAGRPFIRNICMALDEHAHRNNSTENHFSQAV